MKPTKNKIRSVIVTVLIISLTLGRYLYSYFVDQHEEALNQELIVERQEAWQKYIQNLGEFPQVGYDEVEKFHEVEQLESQITFSDRYIQSSNEFADEMERIYYRQIVTIAGKDFQDDPTINRIYLSAIELLESGKSISKECMVKNKEFYQFLLDTQQNFSLSDGRIFFSSAALGAQYQGLQSSMQECEDRLEEVSKDQEEFLLQLLELKYKHRS